jgi:hypothetical protein
VPQRRRTRIQRDQATTGLASRYDKLAIVYRAAAVVRAIAIWLPYLSDTP